MLGPGGWFYPTPQVYGPDDVLELQFTGGAGCWLCYRRLVFQNTVHFGGTLKVTLGDPFLPIRTRSG